MMLNKTPLISIVVLNYNGLNDSRECIQSLLKTNYIKTEIIIVDNGSVSNDANQLISEFGTQIKVIRFNKNTGFAQGNNLALKYCKGKYVSLLNNDTIFKKTG